MSRAVQGGDDLDRNTHTVVANKQVRAGNGRPAVKPAVYAANKKSDRDKDGTACEA